MSICACNGVGYVAYHLWKMAIVDDIYFDWRSDDLKYNSIQILTFIENWNDAATTKRGRKAVQRHQKVFLF